jgi:hypothetical protein
MATANVRGDSAFAYPPHLPPRAAIETAVETLVAVLNAMDGDADVEEDDPQGDVTDDDAAFDERSRFIANQYANGPGCMTADPDYGGEEAGEPECAA